MHLRPYQQDAIDAAYRHLREREDNPVVVIPTAGGKTPILATICRDAVARWNGRVLVVSHVKELLQQAVDKLKQVCPELPVGVYSAGLNRRDTAAAVIVAGIQSIYKRACELDAFDLIIVDEAHLIPTDGDGMYRQFLAEAKVLNPHLRVIGLTATSVPARRRPHLFGRSFSERDLLRDWHQGTDPRRVSMSAREQVGRCQGRHVGTACTRRRVQWPMRSRT
jgi:DNA repair protein RadD